MRVAVVGASGFVGSAASAALRNRGHNVIPVRAPRLKAGNDSALAAAANGALEFATAYSDAIVNCAGVPEATGAAAESMTGANAVLPGLIAEIAFNSGIRLVHVSSAAVQGRRPLLDATHELSPFSPYSESKAAGELAALAYPTTVVYRPPGVHGEQRQVTRTIARIARSPLASVAGSGRANSAQALIENVGDAIAFLATCEAQPPSVVSHPSEGLTVAGLLEDLGGKTPRHIPQTLARSVVAAAFLAARTRVGLNGTARRLEMLWFGQDQAPSWLTAAGWKPPRDRTAWREIGQALDSQAHRRDFK